MDRGECAPMRTGRHEEYYDMTKVQDILYQKSLANETDGINLYKYIISKENILLAYRNIKSNTGSKTSGVDGLNINDYKIINEKEFIYNIRKRLANFKPNSVRRVEIPKDNGKKRPLGIPTMEDRLIQQMFKQILEPICEAKFHPHSYGFRPARQTIDAKARIEFIINHTEIYYVVDMDIESFFDNINHSRLIKQCYNIGIKDRKVLAIIGKMLKAPIKGIGIPDKGTPQGGILSPLLSNIALNDLDWWISNQWETFESNHKYSRNDSKFKALKTASNLKQMFLVRYADDFKIFTNTKQSAEKIYFAVEDYLKTRLKLNISKEKSKIVDVRRTPLEFVGFSIKAEHKGKKILNKEKVDKLVAHSHIKPSKINKTIKDLRRQIKKARNNPREINKLNSMILGLHNYFKFATQCNNDFSKIAYRLKETLHSNFKEFAKYAHPKEANQTYKKLYSIKYKTYKVKDMYVYPIANIQTQVNKCFTQEKTPYTPRGREIIQQQELRSITIQFKKLLERNRPNDTIEYCDNRISKYSEQLGKCAITGKFLGANQVECHHIIPKELGGTDEYRNLVIICEDIHTLIHATSELTMKHYVEKLKLNNEQLSKVNTFRAKCNLTNINI